MSLVDVYDALVSERPYKKAYTKEQALQIIHDGSAVQFDPSLVKVFIDAIKRFFPV
jgi:putative two-component system response regulator